MKSSCPPSSHLAYPVRLPSSVRPPSHLFPCLTGHTPADISSGVGWVHNTYLFDWPQKSVLYAPWSYSPRPLWSAGQTNLQMALPWSFK